jgi:hypothetical protein
MSMYRNVQWHSELQQILYSPAQEYDLLREAVRKPRLCFFSSQVSPVLFFQSLSWPRQPSLSFIQKD